MSIAFKQETSIFHFLNLCFLYVGHYRIRKSSIKPLGAYLISDTPEGVLFERGLITKRGLFTKSNDTDIFFWACPFTFFTRRNCKYALLVGLN